MGSVNRRKSGNVFAGSKLNVPGQGIYNVKIIPNDGVPLKVQKDRIPRPPKEIPLTPTPTATITITTTPTPTITTTPTPTPSQVCYLGTEDSYIISAENLDLLIIDCPTLTPTNTPTLTPTPTPTSGIVMKLSACCGGAFQYAIIPSSIPIGRIVNLNVGIDSPCHIIISTASNPTTANYVSGNYTDCMDCFGGSSPC